MKNKNKIMKNNKKDKVKIYKLKNNYYIII